MLGSKHPKSDVVAASKDVQNARAIPLDLEEVMPENIREWMSVVSKSINTSTEFVLLSCLPATAVLMGPSSVVKVQSTYSEPINIYSIVLSPPGAGKSQTFDLTVRPNLA